MKHKKKVIFFWILVFAMAFCIGIIMNMPNLSLIKDISQLKEAGLVELMPVGTKQDSKSVYEKGKGSHLEITNYVEFQFEIEGAQKTIWLPTLNTYGRNDGDLGKKAVKEKIVNYRYIFYTDDKIYTSAKSENLKDFVKEKIGGGIVVPLFIIAVGFIIKIIQFISSKSRLPGTFQGDIGVCRHNSVLYIFLFLLVLPVTIVVVGCTITQIIPHEEIAVIITFLLLSLVFMGLTLFFAMFIWNRVLVISKDEIVFRDTLGKVFRYDYSEVNGYREKSGYRYHNLEIVTEHKVIIIRADCVDCDEVMEYLQRYYHLVE